MNKKLVALIIALIVLALVGLVAFYNWPQTPDLDETLQPLTSSPPPVSITNATSNSKFFDNDRDLVWKQITSGEDQLVDDDTLAFTLDGQPVSHLTSGQNYYVVSKNAYRYFTPRNMNDLLRLQIPGTHIIPRGLYEAWVDPASTWVVPQDIDGILRYEVHYGVPGKVPAGTEISSGFTIWLMPWSE